MALAADGLAQTSGDFDTDGDVDFLDLDVVSEVRNSAAEPDDPRDVDRNGTINLLDARLLSASCLRPLCEVGVPATTSVEALSASQDEGDVGTLNLGFRIARNGDTTYGSSVDYSFEPFGEHPLDEDDLVGPVFPTGTVAFLPGETEATLNLEVLGDTGYEASESTLLRLSGAEGTALVQAGAVSTVANDDPLGAFTAQASSSVHDSCLDLTILGFGGFDTEVSEVSAAMDDLGYNILRPTAALSAPASGDPYPTGYQPSDTPMLRFLALEEDEASQPGEYFPRFGGQDVLLIITCTPPAEFPWSLDVQVESLVFTSDPSGPVFGPPIRASIGEHSINQANVVADTPAAANQIFAIAVTGDSQTKQELEQAFADEGITIPLNLLPIADIQIPVPEGLPVDVFSESAEDESPPALITVRWNFDAAGYGAFQSTGETAAFTVLFYKDQERPRTPIAPGVDPHSVAHEGFSEQWGEDFEDLATAVVDYFESEQGLLFQSSSTLVSQNNADVALSEIGTTYEGGQVCIDEQVDCGNNSNDTLYSWPFDSHQLAADDVFVMFGLDYTRLDGLGGPMATQAILGLHDPEPLIAGGLENYYDFAYRDAAQARRTTPLRSLPNWDGLDVSSLLAENAFLVKLARPSNCPAGEDAATICLDTTDLPLEKDFVFISRLVLNPATATRPSGDQVIPWRLFHFKVPAP